MPDSICVNPARLQRRRQIATEPGTSITANPRLGLLIGVSTAVVFYGAIGALIWHFL